MCTNNVNAYNENIGGYRPRQVVFRLVVEIVLKK